LGSLVSRIAEVLGVGEDCVDIVDLDSANSVLLFKILSEGVLLKGGGEALKMLAVRASLYPDALIELRMWSSLDPDPMPDAAVISSRVEEIRRNVHFIKSRVRSRRPDELDYGDVLALERALHRTIKAMLDIRRHLVSVYSPGLAESYSEYRFSLDVHLNHFMCSHGRIQGVPPRSEGSLSSSRGFMGGCRAQRNRAPI